MFFDKNYIELICSPDILIDEPHDMRLEEGFNWLEEHDLRYEFEERAAILEYDGGLNRDEAEAHALLEIKQRMRE